VEPPRSGFTQDCNKQTHRSNCFSFFFSSRHLPTKRQVVPGENRTRPPVKAGSCLTSPMNMMSIRRMRASTTPTPSSRSTPTGSEQMMKWETSGQLKTSTGIAAWIRIKLALPGLWIRNDLFRILLRIPIRLLRKFRLRLRIRILFWIWQHWSPLRGSCTANSHCIREITTVYKVC
jgi:hypothetical protein